MQIWLVRLRPRLAVVAVVLLLGMLLPAESYARQYAFVETLHSHYDPEKLAELVSEVESWTTRLAAVESAVAHLLSAGSPAGLVEHEDQGVTPAAGQE